MPVIRLTDPSVHQGLQGSVALEHMSLRPRYWATVWAILDGAHLAPSTLSQYLGAIDRLYLSVYRQTGTDCLDRLIGDLDFPALEQCLAGYFSEIQNKVLTREKVNTKAWWIAYSFVTSTLDRLLSSEADASKVRALRKKVHRLSSLYGSLRPSKETKPTNLRALPAEIVEAIYDLIDPNSRTNPFRTEHDRWRNQALILLYLHQGLRRGEALLLPANPVRRRDQPNGEDNVSWINVTNDLNWGDSRSDRPSIKTGQSHRQIPISDTLAALLTSYSSNWRGKQPHPFLFVSNRNKPLSVTRVNRVFLRLSEALPSSAKALLRDTIRSETISPHDLRHTCAVVRLTHFIDAGLELDIAIQRLRTFFGWSFESEMPKLYARAYFENRLATVWQDSFDAHVSALRRLRSSI